MRNGWYFVSKGFDYNPKVIFYRKDNPIYGWNFKRINYYSYERFNQGDGGSGRTN